MASAIREHAERCELVRIVETEYGTRYVVEGELKTPDGRNPVVRIVWFVEKGKSFPHLVTAYPLGRDYD